jgi:hypothetical protein
MATQKKKPSVKSNPKSKAKKGGFNLAPLISAVLLAGIKLSLEQQKIANKNKTSKTKSGTKTKSDKKTKTDTKSKTN